MSEKMDPKVKNIRLKICKNQRESLSTDRDESVIFKIMLNKKQTSTTLALTHIGEGMERTEASGGSSLLREIETNKTRNLSKKTVRKF